MHSHEGSARGWFLFIPTFTEPLSFHCQFLYVGTRDMTMLILVSLHDLIPPAVVFGSSE